MIDYTLANELLTSMIVSDSELTELWRESDMTLALFIETFRPRLQDWYEYGGGDVNRFRQAMAKHAAMLAGLPF